LENNTLANALALAEAKNDTVLQARLRSMSAKFASGWLKVIPSKTLSLDMKPNAFLITLRWWLGLRQFTSKNQMRCNKCDSVLDEYGYHALTCKHGGDLTHRHNAVRDVILKSCQMAGWSPGSETPGLIANSDERPADIFIPHHTNGKSCAADIAVTHALQPSSITYAAREASGAATRYAKMVKDKKYKKLLEDQDYGIDFLPLVVDCFGAWDQRAIKFFKKIAGSISKFKSRPYSETISQLMEKISVTLMRANAKALLRRRPTQDIMEQTSHIGTHQRSAALEFLDNTIQVTEHLPWLPAQN
jgi:hypothetical protein